MICGKVRGDLSFSMNSYCWCVIIHRIFQWIVLMRNYWSYFGDLIIFRFLQLCKSLMTLIFYNSFYNWLCREMDSLQMIFTFMIGKKIWTRRCIIWQFVTTLQYFLCIHCQFIFINLKYKLSNYKSKRSQNLVVNLRLMKCYVSTQ